MSILLLSGSEPLLESLRWEHCVLAGGAWHSKIEQNST